MWSRALKVRGPGARTLKNSGPLADEGLQTSPRVACFLFFLNCSSVDKSCLTLCDSMDCSRVSNCKEFQTAVKPVRMS